MKEKGMLWFCDNNASIDLNLLHAIKYYEKKYDKSPNIVYMNWEEYAFLEETFLRDYEVNIKIEPDKKVQKRHLIIGID